MKKNRTSMMGKSKPHIFFIPENCSGCRRCQLICSYSRRNIFSLTSAKINIISENHGFLARFSHQCNKGVDRSQDQIPDQWINKNPFRNYVTGAFLEPKDYEMMMEDYYEERGWNKTTGLPPDEG
jgi:Fe-S-cluster-containing dehydrogenase component